jgi:ABC-type sugar transport system ATPase subunit
MPLLIATVRSAFPASSAKNVSLTLGIVLMLKEHSGINGRIELIEPLGSQVMIQVSVGNDLVSAQFERGPEVEVGKDIMLVHRPNSIHAFDSSSERSVLAPAN